MKKTLLFILVVAFAVTVNAQTSDKKWGIGAGVGAYGTLKDGGIGFMPELYFSRYLSSRFDLMLKGDMGLFNSDVVNALDLVNTSLNLRFKLSDESKNLRPYIYAGPGYLADNTISNFNFNAGLGTKYYLSEATALYLEAGYIHGIKYVKEGTSFHDNFVKGTVGIEFDFGKAKDSDMDGVPDRKDKCPSTPAGVAVDENGCPLDTDGDGVADYIDDCPTVAGLASLKGCPDADGDGVADKDDKCPDTPKGYKVDASGCPLDTDKDGVVDALDKCPNTPVLAKVDAAGCPVDTDGDGVADYLDDCPTVVGPKDNKGCPVVEKPSTLNESGLPIIEPVYFNFDQSNYINGEKVKIDRLVTLLKDNKDYKVNLVGFTDSKGTEEYNMALSKRRLNSVINTMTGSGIKKTRISQSEAMGEASPDATNDTEAGRALNRRVEIELIKK